MPTALTVPAPPVKVSRYRSLRGKSVSETRKTIDDVLKDSGELQGGGIFSKAVSKARKRSKTVTAEQDGEPPVPSMPLSQKEQNILSKSPAESKLIERSDSTTLGESGILASIHNRFPVPPPLAVPVATALTVDTAVSATIDSKTRRREIEERLVREERERQLGEEVEAARWADEVARLEAETDRILAEQKKRDLARLQAQLASQPAVALQEGSKSKSPVLDKLSFLARGRRSQAATLSPTSSACASVDFSRSNSLEPHLTPRTFIPPRFSSVSSVETPNNVAERVSVAFSSGANHQLTPSAASPGPLSRPHDDTACTQRIYHR
jgi:hypothetical protein